MTASTGTGEAMMARKVCLVAATILLGIVAAVGLARPAYAQEVDCRAATAAQYQYEDCDEDTTIVVPPRPEPPRPDPPGPRPDPQPPGGGVTAIVGVDEPEGAAGAAAVGERGSSASAAVSAAASAPATAPAGTAAAEGGASGAAVLPDTGGVAPALPLISAALLLGTGVLAGGWILRSRERG